MRAKYSADKPIKKTLANASTAFFWRAMDRLQTSSFAPALNLLLSPPREWRVDLSGLQSSRGLLARGESKKRKSARRNFRKLKQPNAPAAGDEIQKCRDRLRRANDLPKPDCAPNGLRRLTFRGSGRGIRESASPALEGFQTAGIHTRKKPRVSKRERARGRGATKAE